MKGFLFIVLRLILGLFLVLLFLKNLTEINNKKIILLENIEAFEKNILIPYNINTDLNLLKQHPMEILYFENLCVIYGAFLLILGFSLSRTFILIGFLIEMIFINNIYFNRDQKSVTNFSLLLGIFGGILNINKH
jgi:hypothetical protein